MHTGVDDRAGRAVRAGPGATVHLADGCCSRASGCWWPPGAAPTWPGWASAALGLDEAAARPPGRRSDAGAAGGVGGRRRHGKGFLHPRRHVPGQAVCRRHPRTPAARGRLPRLAEGDLHRSRDRLGRVDRGAGPGSPVARSRVLHEPIAASAAGGSTGARGSSSWSSRDGVLVGATSMGPAGGEVLGLLALAVHAADHG